MKHTCLRPCEKMDKIGARIRSIAPYCDVNESPGNFKTSSTIDFKFDKRLWTDEDLNDQYDTFVRMNDDLLTKYSFFFFCIQINLFIMI